MQERDCVAEVASVMGIMRNLSHTVTPKTYLQLPGGSCHRVITAHFPPRSASGRGRSRDLRDGEDPDEVQVTQVLDTPDNPVAWGKTVGAVWIGCDANAELGDSEEAMAVLGPSGHGHTCARGARLLGWLSQRGLVSAASYGTQPWEDRWTHQHSPTDPGTRNCIDYVFMPAEFRDCLVRAAVIDAEGPKSDHRPVHVLYHPDPGTSRRPVPPPGGGPDVAT